MRIIFLATLNLIAVTLYCLWYPQDVWSGLGSVSNFSSSTYRSVFYGRDVYFVGLKHIRNADLSAKLPRDRSNLWWHTFPSDVVAGIRQNSMVESAEVSSCP